MEVSLYIHLTSRNMLVSTISYPKSEKSMIFLKVQIMFLSFCTICEKGYITGAARHIMNM